MLLSNILSEMNYEFRCIQEREINSMGLAGYNNADAVCTFVEDKKYLNQVTEQVTMIITNVDVAKSIDTNTVNFGLIIVDNPRIVFFEMHNFLSTKKEYCGEENKTQIGGNCKISSNAVIAPRNVIIGDNVIIEEFVSIKENTIIGDNTIIRAGCRIGGEGFEFKRKDDIVFLVKHVGWIIIGENVEIQYNSCIDKAIYPWDKTVIGSNTKIDNLVHIAHGVKIGNGAMIVAHSGIGGRVQIGNNAWIGFNSTIRNGINIGNNARTNMGAVVTRNVDDNQAVTGNFAIEHSEFIRKLKEGV